VREVNLESSVLPQVRILPSHAEFDAMLDEVAMSRDPEARAMLSVEPASEEGRIVGRHPAFLEVLEKARRVAVYDISMLIQGETGTGKELLARLIHENSSRAGEPFVTLNCSAIGASLAESDLPPEIQPKLLRALEAKTILPVGADAEVKANALILAATNQDLPKLIGEGRFRRDL
jgi:anaerobic nitric oxide reductase transcription regulator